MSPPLSNFVSEGPTDGLTVEHTLSKRCENASMIINHQMYMMLHMMLPLLFL